MTDLKQDPISISTDLLPTPEVLTDDLEKIVHNLAGWESQPLLGLRSLPSIRFTEVDGHFAVFGDSNIEARQGVPSNAVIPVRIGEAIGRIAEGTKRRALRALFTWTKTTTGVGERQKKAGEELGIPFETFRRTSERDLLFELASEMFRGELAWAIYQFRPEPIRGRWSINSWCQLLEFERSLVISPQGKQKWTTRHLLRCTRADMPFLVTTQRWSGGGEGETGKEPGKVTILSENKKGTFPARLLDVRRESDSQSAYTVYLWDIGGIPRIVGDEIEHIWQQDLVDTSGRFVPFIGYTTEAHPQLRKLRLRVKLPASMNATVYAKRLTMREGSTANAYAGRPADPVGEPIPITDRDDEGYYVYQPSELVHGLAYELWWGAPR